MTRPFWRGWKVIDGVNQPELISALSALHMKLPKLAALGAGCWWAATVPSVMSAGPMLQTDVYLFIAALQLVALGCVARGWHRAALAPLAFAALTSLYLAIAIPWEERSLVAAFGDAYRRYQRQVRWRMIPFIY